MKVSEHSDAFGSVLREIERRLAVLAAGCSLDPLAPAAYTTQARVDLPCL